MGLFGTFGAYFQHLCTGVNGVENRDINPGAPEILPGRLILHYRKRKSSWKSYNQGICGFVPSDLSLRGVSV
jgi:hypothetical protein